MTDTLTLKVAVATGSRTLIITAYCINSDLKPDISGEDSEALAEFNSLNRAFLYDGVDDSFNLALIPNAADTIGLISPEQLGTYSLATSNPATTILDMCARAKTNLPRTGLACDMTVENWQTVNVFGKGIHLLCGEYIGVLDLNYIPREVEPDRHDAASCEENKILLARRLVLAFNFNLMRDVAAPRFIDSFTKIVAQESNFGMQLLVDTIAALQRREVISKAQADKVLTTVGLNSNVNFPKIALMLMVLRQDRFANIFDNLSFVCQVTSYMPAIWGWQFGEEAPIAEVSSEDLPVLTGVYPEYFCPSFSRAVKMQFSRTLSGTAVVEQDDTMGWFHRGCFLTGKGSSAKIRPDVFSA